MSQLSKEVAAMFKTSGNYDLNIISRSGSSTIQINLIDKDKTQALDIKKLVNGNTTSGFTIDLHGANEVQNGMMIYAKDIIDICFDIVNNNAHYTFEWSKDFGYIEDSFEHKFLSELSHYINVFNGILQFDGDSWAQFFCEIQFNDSAYHSKYGKDLAMLICTSSNEELEAIINEVEIANDLLGKDKEMIGGKLGGILEKYSGNLDKEVGELYETCEKILEEVKKGNTDVVEYNRSYQALEDALDKQAWFSDLGGDAIMQLQSELSGVMSFLTVGAKMLEIVNYQEEFKNQDEFSVQAFSVYLEDAQRQVSIPKETVSSMLEYSEKFQDDLLNYSLSRWWDEIAREIILEEAIGEVLTTKANVILLVWDLASNYIPVLSGGLSAAEKFELTLYASAFQYGAFENSRNYRIQLFEDISNITPENLYKLAQYYYIYLKSCYITREAALGSLAGKMEIDSYREKLQPLVDYQNAINMDIAEMLVKLKEAETNNEKLVHGFLPEDNVEYLEKYDDSKLVEQINQVSSKVVSVDWQSFYTDSEDDAKKRYAIITALNENEEVVWKYETKKCMLADGDTVKDIGIFNEKYYFLEEGNIIALNLLDGSKIWENSEFGGDGVAFDFGKDGELYICGFHGPEFFAVDADGNTLANIVSFIPEYWWPCKIEYLGKNVRVSMDGSDFGKAVDIEVDIEDYSYDIVSELTQDELLKEICQKVINHFNGLSGVENYCIFRGECQKTEDGYILLVRSKLDNKFVTYVFVDINTRQAETVRGHIWSLDE